MGNILDHLISNEDRERLTTAVWDKLKESLERDVTCAIHNELRMDVNSRARQLVSREMDAALRPLIEAKRSEIQAAAEKIVSRLFERLESKAIEVMRSSLNTYSYQAADDLAQKLSLSIRSGMDKDLTERMRELDEERRKQREAAP